MIGPFVRVRSAAQGRRGKDSGLGEDGEDGAVLVEGVEVHAGRTAGDDLTREARGPLDADLLATLGVGSTSSATASSFGSSSPVSSSTRRSRAGEVMGMMPGWIGIVTPAWRARSTKTR
ncbi:hypothetical protein [Microbacterium sp. NIBRBAC000506063]|uniref:hypothetical protein n=1 Tax=Microbacterium sp. NIBRBAC000506063 TaxID=2734618 RepID=UPI0021D3F7D1|nr:hypothetical protein [Microbacterium sp. NIBRBAC000506063]